MKRSVPDDEYTDDEEYSDDYVYVNDDENYTSSHTSGTVVFLGITAALCVVVLLVVLGASFLLPRLRDARLEREDDPGTLLHGLRLEEEAELKDNPILETEPEETTEPTIPPEVYIWTNA